LKGLAGRCTGDTLDKWLQGNVQAKGGSKALRRRGGDKPCQEKKESGKRLGQEKKELPKKAEKGRDSVGEKQLGRAEPETGEWVL